MLGQFRRLLPSDCVQLLSDLKAGEVFSFPDGTQVGPADIFLGTPHPRKICFAFDTCDASRLLPFAQGADILVSATAAQVEMVQEEQLLRLLINARTIAAVSGA